MRCPNCGFNTYESAKFCPECGMPFDAKRKETRQNKDRKVVKLPSDASNKESKPIERPWEVAVPKRSAGETAAAGAATTAGFTGMADASDNSGSGSKSPTPRRRNSSSLGTTGKIPPIKHPTHESGKIPAEERTQRIAHNDDAQNEASAPKARSSVSRKTEPMLIVDDDVVETTSAKPEASPAAVAAAYSSRATQPRSNTRKRSMQRDGYSAQKDSRGMGKSVIIAIAILIIICLIALGVFLVNTNGNDRTISFDTDGGTVIGNQYVVQDGKLDRPANPTRPGYTFEGWYLDADYSEKAEFPIDVTQDMTLYAKWQKETATSNTGVPSTTTTPGSTSTDGSTDTNAANNSSSASNGNSSSNGSGSSSSGAAQGGTSTKPSASSSSKPSTGNSGASSSNNAGSSSGNSSTPSNLNGPGVTNGKVNIQLTANNGSKLTGTVTLKNGYVIPNSSTKAYTIDELKALNLNPAELCIARNEIYARQGYDFRNSGLQAYFNARSWYHNSGKQIELATNSAGYITAHNLLALAKQSSSASKWIGLKLS